MPSSENDLRLQQCLEKCISSIEDKMEMTDRAEKGNGRQMSTTTIEINNSQDTDIHTFSIDQYEENVLSETKAELEYTLKQAFPTLTQIYRRYLVNLLYENNYDYKNRKFSKPFFKAALGNFLNDLREMLASIDAFQAAWAGDKNKVDAYLKSFPKAKNKTGIYGTTLLYSAARNNHLNLVKYLVRDARCSVNAQNQQHIKRALAKPIEDDDDFDPNPSSGSTALHGACYYGHLTIVKFLVEYGADFFIQNHSNETPIMNAQDSDESAQAQKESILQYFRETLILGYSLTSNSLPCVAISEESNEYIVDCFWEYKPFADAQWFLFSNRESQELQKALTPNIDPPFKNEIHLSVRNGIYSVSLVEFLRSGKNHDRDQNLAWVRCRGSSIANFQCYGLWQVMLQKHPSAETDSSMKMLSIPTINDSRFHLKLNSWYFCDAKANHEFDRCMNQHRRRIKLELGFFPAKELEFDLLEFSFSDKDRSICGYLRWIPKMISNISRQKKKIIEINDFQTLANLDPIPLTTQLLRELSGIKDSGSKQDESEVDEDEWDENNVSTNDDSFEDTDDDSSDETESQLLSSYKSTSCSVHDIVNDNKVDESSIDDADDCSEENIQGAINAETAGTCSNDQIISKEKEVTSPVDQTEAITALKSVISKLEGERDELAKKLGNKAEEVNILLLETKATHERKIGDLLEEIANLNMEVDHIKEEEEEMKKFITNRKTKEYENIENNIVSNILVPKHSLIIGLLKESYHAAKFAHLPVEPRIEFREENGKHIVKLIAFEPQHAHFNRIMNQIQSFSKIIQAAKDYYERHLKRTIRRFIMNTLKKVKDRTENWKEYQKLLVQLIEVKGRDSKKLFDDHTDEYSKQMMDDCIYERLHQPWIIIRQKTNDFIEKSRLIDDIEPMKRKALDEFIEQNILLQRANLSMKPTVKSVRVLQNYIDKVKEAFKNEPQYQGHELIHFELIPKLLKRIMIYHASFKVQLPLYESSKELLDKIENHAITTISTSTGSGKSTLLPALLIAEGYDKVMVTQPRRLPCQLISQRVNETMKSDIRLPSEPLAGWAVSGTESNPQAKVLYLTDGLLKERLLNDTNFITNNTTVTKSVVFFIDEVHERSVNIDICLALLARLLTINPGLKSKMKVIISSATLDSSVPKLFRQIPQAGVAEFQMPQMGTLYQVDKFPRPNENVIDIVLELCKKRKRHEQILCFVNSVAEVNQCINLMTRISKGTIVAHPLVQSQHPNTQQQNIEHGTIFFSTTVAETSLTFPCLKYVIDTGMINSPIYDPESKRTKLEEIRAAESTIKQRLGRLGRTQTGEYYFVYDFKVDDVKFPNPQICQSDLMNIEFSLRKSSLQKGFQYFKQFLPDKPSDSAIKKTIEQLVQLKILKGDNQDSFTKYGESLAKLPDFGSLAMSKAVLAAFRHYDCGYDLICLSSILGVLNTTALFKSIPQVLKSPEGDFMTLFNIMNEILLVRESCSAQQFDLGKVCQAKGLKDIQHVIKQTLRRYTALEKILNNSPDFRRQAQIKSGRWESIARSLLAGYSDNVFVSMKELQSRSHHFIRYNGKGEVAVLDLQSTLTRPISQAPVAVVLARDIRHSTAIRKTAIISFAGEIKPEWMEHNILREVELYPRERTYLDTGNIFTTARSKFCNRIKMTLSPSQISLEGAAGSVFDAELHCRQQMVREQKFLLEHRPGVTPHQNFRHNLESIMKMPKIFNPLIWRWRAQKQVEITVNADTANKTCEITVKGTDADFDNVKKEFDTFISWLEPCAVIRHPNAGASPRVLHPQMRKECKEMEARIARITDPDRTIVDLYKSVKGSKASRETRMEVVAWIAVCKFDCKLEGGFIRDWIVGGYTARPTNAASNPRSWISYNGQIPYLDKEVVPCDLDCHLPSHAYFDIEKFQDELYKYDISVTYFREAWRYVLLLDENASTGPFTMDLIEPHVALTHDRIDFDVNNLYVEKQYTHELGMRIDIEHGPYRIALEKIIENIKNKRLQVLRQTDNNLTSRIQKMVGTRGWTKIDPDLSVVPEPHFKRNAILVPLPKSSTLYKEITNKMQVIGSIKIQSIEEIRNPSLEETYLGMKKLIKKQCPNQNPNEQELFHGTHDDGIEGIVEDGFDDRFFNTGLYGSGAYFADDPKKSHSYAKVQADGKTRVMFYNKVLLGIPQTLTASDNKLKCAPKGHHSIIGKHNPQTEYIVYRYGQALPYLKIVYEA